VYLLWLHTYYGYTLTMATHLLWLHTYYGYTLTMATHLLWLHTHYGYTCHGDTFVGCTCYGYTH
jgi:hypothetical protein